MAKGYTPDVFREAFRKTQESTFLVQKKKQPVHLDWLLEEQNLTRVLEGAYADRPAAKPAAVPACSHLGQMERESIARMLREQAAPPP